MKKLSGLIALLAAMVLVLSACSSEPQEDLSTAGTQVDSDTKAEAPTEDTDVAETEDVAEEDTQVAEEPAVEEEPEAEETVANEGPALPVSMPDGRGNEIEFDQYKGKLLLVNFFGTWCTYCMQEMPDFQKFTENYSDVANIVIVNALETEKAGVGVEGVVEWYEDNGYTMQMVIDEDKSRTIDFYGAIQGFPTTFVYDADQNFLGYIPGMMDYALLESIVSEYGPQ